ncbi:hypothetical protein K9M09_00990 [Patescibacteria group bacterium]|nr:hypothetical protein [Patescibacteria group bacterium]
MNNFLRRKSRSSLSRVFNSKRSSWNLRNYKRQLDFLSKMFSKRLYFISALILLLIVSVYYFTRTSVLIPDKNAKKEEIKSKQECTRSVTSFWCESSKQCLDSADAFCADEINALIARMESSMNVTFNDLGRENFVWNLSNEHDLIEDTNVYGEIYVAQEMSMNKLESLQRYLEINLQASNENIINGISGGLRGYYLNNMVCTLDFRYKEMKVNAASLLVPVSDSLNVKFRCGYISQNQALNASN